MQVTRHWFQAAYLIFDWEKYIILKTVVDLSMVHK